MPAGKSYEERERESAERERERDKRLRKYRNESMVKSNERWREHKEFVEKLKKRNWRTKVEASVFAIILVASLYAIPKWLWPNTTTPTIDIPKAPVISLDWEIQVGSK